MSRRDRRPGAIKYNPTSQNTFAPQDREGLTNWISIDPTVGGAPSAPPDFSDNDNLPIPGVWYRRDGNGTLDTDGGGSYFNATADGLTMYLKKDVPDDARWGHLYNGAGRFCTPLEKQNGEVLRWEENFGIEFLILQPNPPEATAGKKAGVTIGIGDDALYTSEANNGVTSYFLSVWHANTTTAGLSYQIGGPSGAAGNTGSDTYSRRATMCIPYFSTYRIYDPDTKVWGLYVLGYTWRENGTNNNRHSATSASKTIDPDYTSNPKVNSQVHLFVAPTWNLSGTPSDDPGVTVTLEDWKLFYRIRWTPDRILPEYVPGRRNNHSGITKASY